MGYSNPGGRWQYAIPTLGAAGPSTGANDGRYFGQIARLAFPGGGFGDRRRATRGGGGGESAYTDPLC